jgi:hypothetical protein
MNTKQLTRGAMCTAFYAVLLFLNQQTALSIETAAPWLFIFPLLIYTAQSSFYAGCICCAAMFFETFLFGSFTTWFYSWSSLLTGLVLGECIRRQMPGRYRLIILFVLNFAANLVTMVLWANVFGMDYTEDFALVKAVLPWLDLKTFILLFTLLYSILGTVCIHVVAQAVCLRLHIPIPPLTKVSQIRPSFFWTAAACAAVIAFFAGQNMLLWNEEVQNAVLFAAVLAAVLLDWYGVLFFLSRPFMNRRLAPLVILGAFVPYLCIVWMGAGAFYGLSQHHRKELEPRG